MAIVPASVINAPTTRTGKGGGGTFCATVTAVPWPEGLAACRPPLVGPEGGSFWAPFFESDANLRLPRLCCGCCGRE